MEAFVTAITTIFGGIFSAIVDALGSVGDLIFTVSEGAVTGVAPFGWLLIVGISVPLATWLFRLLFTWIRSLGRGTSGR